jgi:hypothetical protein
MFTAVLLIIITRNSAQILKQPYCFAQGKFLETQPPAAIAHRTGSPGTKSERYRIHPSGKGKRLALNKLTAAGQSYSQCFLLV